MILFMIGLFIGIAFGFFATSLLIVGRECNE